MQNAVRARGWTLHVARTRNAGELDAAFAAIAQSGAAVLIEGNDPLFIDQRKHIVALTLQHRIPTVFFERESVVAGGLMSYAASFTDSFRQVGVYVGRILRAQSPPTCRCCSRPNSISSSISRPPRGSGLRCRTG
jgi:putative ABC transport system substrate-binding protein